MIKSITGARESNAGDDFHLVWAAKKALALLEPNTNFKALSVEGPNPLDAKEFEIDSNDLLSIDVAEYYGEKTFEEASKVIFSQLKYSTRMGNEDWTLAKLCTPSNKKRDNSIIRRLAQTYAGFNKRYSNLESKLVLKLVSNRKIENSLKELINASKKTIVNENIVEYVKLKTTFTSQPEKCMLKKLYDETHLTSREFVSFLICLSFDDCGTAIREIQRSEVIQKLGLWGEVDLKSDYNDLIMFINKQMMPEAENAAPIDKFVIANIFSQTPTSMFPAKPQIIHAKDYVDREIIGEIAEYIVDKNEQYLCLHATGGMGKTTVIDHLEERLPEGSVVLTYDCFGGGDYLNPATPRHLFKRAIPQLCNDLALRCSTPFLLGRGLDKSELLEQFSIRINEATKAIREFNPKAVLIIVLDAIDNSYEASVTNKEEVFATDLLKIKIHQNVVFLVTARTERLDRLELPQKTILLKLDGFNSEEEKQYVRKFFPGAMDSQCEEIRSLSYGNPRVQFYVFSKANYNIDKAIEWMKPNGKMLEEIFKDALNRANDLFENEFMNFSKLCSVLVLMPRPIPIELVLNVSGYSREMLESACSDYLLGIYFSDDYISFRDEDFEVYLRSVSKEDKQIEIRIADFMFKNRLTNDYCMRYLHVFLSKASRFEDLVSIILNKEEVLVPVTQDEKNEQIIARIKSAVKMQEILKPEYRVDALKLLYVSTKCKTTDSTFKDLIKQDLNLTSKYCMQSTVSRYFIALERSLTNINMLSENAIALLLNNNNKEMANEYFESALAAIKRYFDQGQEERRSFNGPKEKDISCLATFIAIEKSPETAVDWLSSWSPYPIQEYYDMICSLLIAKYDDLAEKIMFHSNNIDMFASCISAYLNCCRIVPNSAWSLVEVLQDEIGKKKYKIHTKDFKYRIILAEQLICRGMIKQSQRIVENINLNYDYSYISFYSSQGELPIEYYLQLYALKKLFKGEEYNSEDFWNLKSKSHKDTDKQKIQEEKNKQKKILDYIVPSFFIRLKTIVEDSESEYLLKLFQDEYNKCERFRYSFYGDYNSYDYYRCICTNLCEMFIAFGKIDKLTIKEYCYKLLKDKYLNNKFYFILVRMLSKNDKYIDIAITMLIELEKNMLNYPESSYEMREFYLECSRITTLFDEELGKEYFIKAIEIANGIEEDAYRRFVLYYAAVENNVMLDDSERLEYNLSRIIEDGYRKLNDSKHFPTEKAFQALAYINPCGAMASACRWDDRDDENIFAFDQTIPNIVFILLKNNLISPGLAVTLSNSDIKDGTNYNDIVKMVLQKLESKNKDEARRVLEVLCYDISKLSSGFTNYNIVLMIVQWCENHELDKLSSVLNLKNTYRYVNDLSSNIFRDGKDSKYQDEKHILWRDVDKNKIEFTEESLTDLMEKLAYEDTAHLIKYYFDNCNYTNYEMCVNTFINLLFSGKSRWDKKEHFDIFVYYLSQWSETSPKIRQWRADETVLDRVILLYKEKSYYFQEEKIGYLKRLFTVNTDIIVEKFVSDISLKLEYDAWEIFSYIETILQFEKNANKATFLEWCINEEIPYVHPGSSDKEYDQDNTVGSNLTQSIALYLWRLLGHVEKRNRWYATHTIYNLHKLGEYELIYSLLSLVTCPIFPNSYKDENAYVFYETAVIQLFIAINRIVSDNTSALVSYSDFFKKIALTSDTINILTRKLAREIAIKLNLTKDQNLMKCCNVVASKRIKYNRRFRHYRDKDIKYQFDFDETDMLPHVYVWLGDIFLKSESDVALSCQKYIERLGINNKIVDKWEGKFRKSKYRNKTYGLNTPIELIDKYAQLNAMYYVADEYRKTLPISDDEDPIYTFERWVRSYLPCLKEKWLSDIKDMPPLISQFLDTKLYVNEEDKVYVISDDYFSNIFELIYENKQQLILSASNKIEFDHRRKCIDISTGFIEQKDIEKLKASLEQENFQIEDCYLKDEDEFEDDSDNDYIYKTITWVNTNDSSCEKYDPYNYGMGLSLLKPSKLIETYIGTNDINPMEYSTTEMSQHPVKSQYWNYGDDSDSMYNLTCNGDMIFVEKEILENYIKSQSTLMFLAQVTIEFEDGYSGNLIEKYKRNERRILYIFNNDIIENYEIKLKNYWER